MTVPEIVERLNAQTIAGAKEAAAIRIPNCEGEHAPEKCDRIRAVLFVGMQDGFSVRARDVAVAGLFKRRPQISVVEDFTVVGDPVRASFVGHGLMAAGDIDDAKAAMAEVSPMVVVITEIVRPAVADGIRHSRERCFAAGSGCRADESRDPAHGFSVAANADNRKTRYD